MRTAGTHFDLWLTESYQIYDAKVQDVDVTMRSDATSVPFLQLAHYDEVRLTRVRVTNTCAPELIQTWTDGEIRLRGVAHGAACDVCAAAEPFVCSAI